MQLRSPVGLGTAPLSSRRDGPLWWGPQDDALSIATIEAALEAGIDWIDTAPFYGWGLAEELVGRALSSRPNKVTVLTKCGTQRGPDGHAFEGRITHACAATVCGRASTVSAWTTSTWCRCMIPIQRRPSRQRGKR